MTDKPHPILREDSMSDDREDYLDLWGKTQWHRAEELRLEATFLEETALRAAGWTHSSSYPDCVWRWSKEIDGVVLAVSRAHACKFASAAAARRIEAELDASGGEVEE